MEKLTVYSEKDLAAMKRKWFTYGFVMAFAVAVFSMIDLAVRYHGGM